LWGWGKRGRKRHVFHEKGVGTYRGRGKRKRNEPDTEEGNKGKILPNETGGGGQRKENMKRKKKGRKGGRGKRRTGWTPKASVKVPTGASVKN
jgi:hypothetical protein